MCKVAFPNSTLCPLAGKTRYVHVVFVILFPARSYGGVCPYLAMVTEIISANPATKKVLVTRSSVRGHPKITHCLLVSVGWKNKVQATCIYDSLLP